MGCCYSLQSNEQLLLKSCGTQSVVNGPANKCVCCAGAHVRQALVLRQTDYAKIQNEFTGEEQIIRGPIVHFMGPQETSDGPAAAKVLDETEYITETVMMSGEERIIRGPGLVVPEIGVKQDAQTKTAVGLLATEFVVIKNRFTGDERQVRGPGVVFPKPGETIQAVQKATRLEETQYVIVVDELSREEKMIKGPCTFFPEVTEHVRSVQYAVQLREIEYIYIVIKKTAQIRSVRGPCLFFPDVGEEVMKKQSAIPLKKDEYVKILNTASGQIRTVRGEALLFLDPKEQAFKVQQAVTIDSNQALLIRNKDTAQLELITRPCMFIPGADQEIVELRQASRLEKYHTAVVKDKKKGDLIFVSGPTNFFLPPYCELLSQTWSSGLHKDEKKAKLLLFDRRSHFMGYEFACRTRDNVELILNVTFFWALQNVEALIASTPDAAGDLCSHARSVIIQAISRVTLEEFLDTFNSVVQEAVMGQNESSMQTSNASPEEAEKEGGEGEAEEGSGTAEEGEGEDRGVWKDSSELRRQVARRQRITDGEQSQAASRAQREFMAKQDPFYTHRGLRVHGVEVRSVACKEASTQRVLMDIIQERTDRINRLQKQESQNEVRLKSLQGEIAAQKLQGDLLQAKQSHATQEGVMKGTEEASRVRSFLTGLAQDVPDLNTRLELFNTLRKCENIEHLSGGEVSMVFTPADVDLRVNTTSGGGRRSVK